MQLPLLFLLFAAVVLGAIVGSFLNVCIYRIPLEKSVVWPGSRCGHCLQAIPAWDNIPLISYWLLRGRCRVCKEPFSIRYFLIELLTALAFAGALWFDVLQAANAHTYHWERHVWAYWIDLRWVPLALWGLFFYHAILVSLLIVTSFSDIDHLEIPLSVTISGTLVGLLGGTILWPFLPAEVEFLKPMPFLGEANLKVTPGVYPWPVWSPLPAWLGPHSPLTGLATGLAGVLVGMMVLRVVRFVFGVGRGIEGLGVGDADLMMMAGSFVGWQPIVVAFFVAVFPALLFGVLQLVVRGDQMLPFGPSLALGVMITLVAWDRIGPRFADLFFNSTILIFLAVAGVVVLFIASFMLRLMRR